MAESCAITTGVAELPPVDTVWCTRCAVSCKLEATSCKPEAVLARKASLD